MITVERAIEGSFLRGRQFAGHSFWQVAQNERANGDTNQTQNLNIQSFEYASYLPVHPFVEPNLQP